jgi:hypothetical protein
MNMPRHLHMMGLFMCITLFGTIEYLKVNLLGLNLKRILYMRSSEFPHPQLSVFFDDRKTACLFVQEVIAILGLEVDPKKTWKVNGELVIALRDIPYFKKSHY